MASIRQQLLDKLGSKDPYDMTTKDLSGMQLAAARDLFKERREQVQILDRRATDMGVKSIEKLDDLIPLLFSHTTYKTYPASFVTNGQWDRMNRWISTLATAPINPDVEGVKDIDDWVDRLWKSGNFATTTSGTSGKVSFLNRNAKDLAFMRRYLTENYCWPDPIKAEQSRHYYFFGPRGGPYNLMVAAIMNAELHGRPDSRHFLSDKPMRVSDLSRAAEMRARMAAGSATPQEIAEFEGEAGAQAAENQERFEHMIQEIIDRRHEPLMIGGSWAQFWALMQKARAQGIQDGEFGSNTVVNVGGGLKGAKLPDDYKDQIFKFLGPVRSNQIYGMSEMHWHFPQCEAGNYHQSPGIIPFLLDGEGENPAGERKGIVEGRFGFVDLTIEGRWSGLITGDKVSMDYREQCPCGRPGAVVVRNSISRYVGPGEEDKIGCAGTIDAYIRGAVAD